MTANSSTTLLGASSLDQNQSIDSTRGNLLTDIQQPVPSTPMPSNAIPMALNDTTHHDISTILERPVNLGTFNWSSTDEVLPMKQPYSKYLAGTSSNLKKFDFPQAILEKAPIVVDKLKNYQYFRADIEIEVKFNAQPFLQGALQLVYNPYLEQIGDFRRKGTQYMASQTSCPNEILSIEEGSSLKLICPYANVYDYFDLANADNQFGTVYLNALSALRGNEPASVKYTVFARFVNPTFMVPTHIEVMPTIRDDQDIRRLEAKGYTVAQSSVEPYAASDTGEVETPGPVSKVAKGVTMIADVLSNVPVIGRLASTVAWVSRATMKTAATFGWSKPTTIQPQSKMVIKPCSTMIHTEGNDDAVTLALIQDNGIDGSSFIPENHDEMALSYIFGRPNIFHSQTVSQANFSAQKLLAKWEVSPFSEWQYGEDDDSSTLYLGSFAYASMMGTLWRGEIIFDIRVIKTAFHQGRFAVVYLPETNMKEVPETLGNMLNTNYNVVCDLAGNSMLRVPVPYMSNVPWRKTYKYDKVAKKPNAATLETKTGCMAIYSVVDLSVPPTVSPDVTFYIAHSGGEDYQICRPTCQLAPGFAAQYAQSDVGIYYAQSDTGACTIPENSDPLVPSHKSQDVTGQTSGEYFKSLRSLCKRFGYIGNLSQVDTYTSFRTRHFTEDATGGFRTNAPVNLKTKAPPTPWYMVSFLYRFFHGSSQLKAIPFTSTIFADAFLSYDQDTSNQKNVQELDAYGQPIFAQLQNLSNAFELRTPYYRAVRGDVVNSKLTPVLEDVRTNIRMRNLANTSRTGNMALFEAAGDDYNFYFLVGPPPMVDISNIKAVPTYPSGNSVEVNLSTLTNMVVGTTRNRFTVATYTPARVFDAGKEYGIASSTQDFVKMIYIDGTNEEFPVTSCRISRNTTGYTFDVPKGTGTVDVTPTLAALKAIPKFTVVTDAPPP
nr:MAG: polyprotein 2 [Picornavirales sp.]